MTDEHSAVLNETGSGMAQGMEDGEICNACGTPRDAAQLATHRLRLLSDIGLALSAERDIHRLLNLILRKARELTGADAGSIYIVSDDTNSDTESEGITLHFRAAQNDSKSELNTNVTFPVSSSSLAGYSALRGETLCFEDAYQLPPDAPYRFNPEFDRQHGYRAKSVLVVPLKNHLSEVIGVLQLINRKRDPEVRLTNSDGVVTEEIVAREVLSFDADRAELAATLASQAAVALENNQLIQKIETLFESFVTASASAIEDRDPSTSGHSVRVTEMTLALAEAASSATTGPFKDIHFSPIEIKELRYAGLLHDFGKIGVREKILTKSHKLDPYYFEGMKDRLALLAREREKACAEKKVALLLDLTRGEALLAMRACDEELKHELAEIQEDTRLLTQINDPATSYVSDEEYARQLMVLNKLVHLTYTDAVGELRPILSQKEHETLSVRRGSLTPAEFEQIKEHARLSFEFLQRISWTSEFAEVPELAYSHHEKLNGSGYPRGIKGQQIPLRTRMMTVADIFDALTAADRPYKRAMPADRALQILELEARNERLDSDVVDLFIEHGIYKIVEEMQPHPLVGTG